LIATVDVQRTRFVIQVHGIGPGTPYDITVVDRWSITKSKRIEYEDQLDRIRPGTYVDDWELLIGEVINKTYPLDDGSGRRMQIKLTVCDSGGEDGVTSNAYEFYRLLRRRGLASRFHLLKGNPIMTAPRTYIDFPDSRSKSKFAAARGDVPVLFLNSNVLKDALNHRLDSLTPGKGMIRFPSWLPVWFYKELCVEHRDERGRWEGTRGIRNESWDLLYYCIGACASQLVRAESINWLNPPIWADEWAKNPLVVAEKEADQLVRKLTLATTKRIDFAQLGKDLA
jgi:phage terminase large subunit GpA-like protein